MRERDPLRPASRAACVEHKRDVAGSGILGAFGWACGSRAGERDLAPRVRGSLYDRNTSFTGSEQPVDVNDPIPKDSFPPGMGAVPGRPGADAPA